MIATSTLLDLPLQHIRVTVRIAVYLDTSEADKRRNNKINNAIFFHLCSLNQYRTVTVTIHRPIANVQRTLKWMDSVYALLLHWSRFSEKRKA